MFEDIPGHQQVECIVGKYQGLKILVRRVQWMTIFGAGRVLRPHVPGAVKLEVAGGRRRRRGLVYVCLVQRRNGTADVVDQGPLPRRASASDAFQIFPQPRSQRQEDRSSLAHRTETDVRGGPESVSHRGCHQSGFVHSTHNRFMATKEYRRREVPVQCLPTLSYKPASATVNQAPTDHFGSVGSGVVSHGSRITRRH